MKYFSSKIINSKVLKSNYNNLQQYAHKKICAVVKANAYGHNAKVVAKILSDCCDFFAVHNLYEAIEIRKINNKAKILVLGYTIDYNLASKYNISVMIDSIEQLKELLQKNINLKVHIKINTGMNRFGIKSKNQLKIAQNLIKNSKKVHFEGIFTHFYDTNNTKTTQTQISVFAEYIRIIQKCFHPIVHIGGSKMTHYNIDFVDYIRCGISLYGYGEKFVNPCLKLESKVIKISHVKRGENVGYKNGFIAPKDMKIGLVPLGYADGIPRNLYNNLYVTVRGKKSKVIGNICMDLFMIDLTELNDAVVFDKVLVFQNADEWSKILGITNYEILTGLNNCRSNILID